MLSGHENIDCQIIMPASMKTLIPDTTSMDPQLPSRPSPSSSSTSCLPLLTPPANSDPSSSNAVSTPGPETASPQQVDNGTSNMIVPPPESARLATPGQGNATICNTSSGQPLGQFEPSSQALTSGAQRIPQTASGRLEMPQHVHGVAGDAFDDEMIDMKSSPVADNSGCAGGSLESPGTSAVRSWIDRDRSMSASLSNLPNETSRRLRTLSLAPILHALRLRRTRVILPPLLYSPSRPSLADLITRSIFLTHTTVVSRKLGRSLVTIRLARRLAARPAPEVLVERCVLPPECIPGRDGPGKVAPAIVAKKRAVERERVKDGLRRWVGAVWERRVQERAEGVRRWEERVGVGRVWRLRRFWERIGRGEIHAV